MWGLTQIPSGIHVKAADGVLKRSKDRPFEKVKRPVWITGTNSHYPSSSKFSFHLSNGFPFGKWPARRVVEEGIAPSYTSNSRSQKTFQSMDHSSAEGRFFPTEKFIDWTTFGYWYYLCAVSEKCIQDLCCFEIDSKSPKCFSNMFLTAIWTIFLLNRNFKFLIWTKW